MKLSEEIIKEKGYKDAKFLAKFFVRTDRHIRKLTTDGIIRAYMFKGAYYYDLIPTIHTYIMYLSKLAEEKSNILDDLNKEKADADILYLRTRAKKAELEVKELENKLLPVEAVKDYTNDILRFIKLELMQIPEKANKEITRYKESFPGKSEPAVIAEILTDVINTALTNMSNYEYTPSKEFIKKYF